jgi:hypothetical protein
MTNNFDTFFHQILEYMTANDVANVGTGWDDNNDNKGGVPKEVLGGMLRRSGISKKKKKKPIKEGYFVRDEEVDRIVNRVVPQGFVVIDKMTDALSLVTVDLKYADKTMKALKEKGHSLIYKVNGDSMAIIVLSDDPTTRQRFFTKHQRSLVGFTPFK